MISASFIFQKGIGTARDDAAASEWYSHASDIDRSGASYALALQYWNEGKADSDFPKAFEMMREAAEAGNPEGMFWYGVWLERRKETSETPARVTSTRWIGKSAEAGFSDGMYYYGVRLRQGYGIPPNPGAAAIWFRRGMEAGDYKAAFTLAGMMEDRTSGIPVDLVESARLYRSVATNENTPPELVAASWYNLGVASSNKGDYTLARALFIRARELGDKDAVKAIKSIDDFQTAERAATERHRTSTLAKVTPAPQSQASGALYGAPRANDIAEVLARSSSRFFGGSLTSTPGEQAFPSPFGGIQHYVRRSVTNVTCDKLNSTTYRCQYDLRRVQVGASDSFWGQLVAATADWTGQNSTNRWKSVILFKGGVWSSSQIDDENRQAAQQSARDDAFIKSRSDAWHEERQRKFDRCMQEIRYIPCSY
jgi:TPR repeat protein